MMQNNPMMVVRSLKGCPASVLWALILVRHALTARELCDYTGYKPDSVREAMRVLAGYNLVIEHRLAHGEACWALAEGAQLLLPGLSMDDQSRIKSDSESDLVIDEHGQSWIKSDSGSEGENQNWKKSDSEIVGIGQSWKKSDSGCPESGQSWKKSDSGDENQGSINLIDDDESINKNINHHQSEPEKTKNAKLEAVLENTIILWGDCLAVDDVPAATTSEMALGWICKIWADIRSGNAIKNPTGLLRARLKSGKRRRVLHDDLLPDEYRVAIGLPVFDEPAPYSPEQLEQVVEETRAELAQTQAKIQERDQKIRAAVAAQVRDAWRSWWENSENFTRAHRENWLNGTVPVGWDGRKLTIAAHNDFAAGWLAQRIETCQILGVEADVEFLSIKAWESGQ